MESPTFDGFYFGDVGQYEKLAGKIYGEVDPETLWEAIELGTDASTNGVAAFPTLSINLIGNGYTLTAASGALTGATSAPFNVGAAGAGKLAFTTPARNITAGACPGAGSASRSGAAGTWWPKPPPAWGWA